MISRKLQVMFFYIFTILILSGCPRTIKVHIMNQSEHVLRIIPIHSDYVLAEIEKGKSETIVFNPNCFRFKVNDALFAYKPALPPDQYFSAGIFSSKFSVVIDKELKVYIWDAVKEEKGNIIYAGKC